MTVMVRIFHDIRNERARQEALQRAGKFPHTCADPAATNLYRLAVMSEEVGEVAHEVVDREDLAVKYAREPGTDWPLERQQAINARLYEELVQVAAVAVAWCEHLYPNLPKPEIPTDDARST